MIEVTLHGKNGTRITQVNEPRGMLTRHVKAPREAVPSIFGDTSIKQPKPEPKQSLAELLSECDAILNPPARVNTQPIDRDCYHYSGYTVKPKTNPDSPLMHYWNMQRQKKSDDYMGYRKQRASKEE